MLRYVLAATALRAFSMNGATKWVYRNLGNLAGGRRRAKGIEPHYIHRAAENLAYIESFGAIADGHQLMELGTGWVHWESLFTRLFYDVKVTLFDVWDNRQFPGFLGFASELRLQLRNQVDRPGDQIDRAEALLDRILACTSFDDVYKLLGFNYIIDPTGSLKAVPDGSIDLVISSDVMEHVPRGSIATLIQDFRRVLKPGARVAQQIVEKDHLTIYAPAAHPKAYLRYDERTWRRWFENDVQYVNRLQHSDFLRAFREAGMIVVDECVVATCDSSEIKIAPEFVHYDKADLDAIVTRIIAQKPLDA
ncbi:MAG TPA: methyltransferase domain-containing protein [Sphingobium sp.]